MGSYNRIATAVLLAYGLWSPVSAQDTLDQDKQKNYNAEMMLRICQQDPSLGDPEMMSLACTFRIQGVVMMLKENCASVGQGYSPLPFLSASPPVSRRALKQAFINFMEDNPDAWEQPWHQVVAVAMSKTFPCEN